MVSADHSPAMTRRLMVIGFSVMLSLVVGSVRGQAAETTDPVPMSKTVVALKVDSEEPIAIQTRAEERPPVIVITFPPHRVIGALPERSTLRQGAIKTITTRYESGAGGSGSTRFIRSMEIGLSAPYAFHVQSEPGRVTVAITHPVSIAQSAVEISLKGGTITGKLAQGRVSERFLAMQQALAAATPTPWTLQVPQPMDAPWWMASMPPQHPLKPLRIDGRPASASSSSRKTQAVITADTRARGMMPTRSSSVMGWVAAMVLLAAAGGTAFWFSRSQLFRERFRRAGRAGDRIPAGIVLMDQLVWRALERQGYRLILETELTRPPFGTLRIITRDGVKAGLLFAGHGPFFEKQTVETFIHALREVDVEQGFLVAAGSFTIPAQRLAKEHRIALVGREQLVELLGTGAGSEFVVKQLEQYQVRLDEAKETLRQYAEELDALRRQRNEASWILGEERAKSAKLEGQLDGIGRQLQRFEADVQRWEQEASTLRKQWEESEWYLGESRAYGRHLETQLTTLQEAVKQTAETERQRDEAIWYLGEARSKREELSARLAELSQRLEDALGRERGLQEAFAQATQELNVLRAYGERRASMRTKMLEATIELFSDEEAADPIFTGAARDVSGTGIGLQSDYELPLLPKGRVRVSIQGSEPIESAVHTVWQRGEGDSVGYQSGYAFADQSEALRSLIKGAANPSSS